MCRKTTNSAAIAVLLLAAAALAVACSTDAKKASTATPVATSAPSPATPAPTSTAEAAATPTSDVFEGLRSRVFATSPQDIGIRPSAEHPHVWGVLVELGLDQGTVTLVALLDGTVSLYTSTGGGIIGAGAHEEIGRAALNLIASAEKSRGDLAPIASHPLPVPGRVRFYLLTFEGTLTSDVAEAELSAPAHPLRQLFLDAEAVLTAIRTRSGPP